jgi:hypothetical protein
VPRQPAAPDRSPGAASRLAWRPPPRQEGQRAHPAVPCWARQPEWP